MGDMLSCSMTMFLPGLMGRGAVCAWMANRAEGRQHPQHSLPHALDIFCHCVGEYRELSAQVSVQLWASGALTTATTGT